MMRSTLVNKALVILHTILIFVTHASLHDKCPQLPSRCICIRNTNRKENTIKCSGIQNDMLKSAFKNVSQYDFANIDLARSKIDILQEEFFSNVSVNKLVLYFSHIVIFRAFAGLSSLRNMKNLHIEQTRVDRWIFTPASKLKDLKIFSLLDCPEENTNDVHIIRYLPETITSITVRWCKLKSEDFSFRRFKNLAKLDLSNNLLTRVNRSDLPQHSWDLKFLSLSHNPISTIPEDMFTQMFALQAVYLESTSMTAFSSVLFKPVLKRVPTFEISGNPFHCDCFNAWLIGERQKWKKGFLRCKSPARHSKKSISSFTTMDMCKPEGEYSESIHEYCIRKHASHHQ